MKAFGALLLIALALGIFAYLRPRPSPRVDLNSGMTAAIASPPPGFHSRRAFPPSDLPARLAAIRWFEHCGEPFTGPLSMPFEQVHSWSEAEKRSAESAWDTATLEAQNQLTLWLHLHAHERYQEWNRHVESHNSATLNPLLARVIEPFQAEHHLSKEFISSIRWNLRSALMEESYRDTGHSVFFFQELLDVYEAGHYPCGWIGEWPNGKLVIY